MSAAPWGPRRRRHGRRAALVVVALAMSACSGDDTGSGGGTTTLAPAAVTTTSSAPSTTGAAATTVPPTTVPPTTDRTAGPTAERIAFTSVRSGEGWLYAVQPDGTAEVVLADVWSYGPSWSPDGTRVAVACDAELPSESETGAGTSDICIAAADGTGYQRLTDDPEPDQAPQWSPDGDRIVFMSFRGTDPTVPGIYLVRPDGGPPAGLEVQEAVPAYDPAWAPDGERLAYVAGIGPAAVVRVIDNEGTVTTLGEGTGPRWSPDGRQVLHSTPSGEVVITGVDDGSQTVIGTGREAVWSPDGTRVAFTASDPTTPFSGDVGVVMVEVTDGTVTDLGEGSQPSWSPDGTRLVVAAAGLWIIDVADGSRTLVVDDLSASEPVWSPAIDETP